MREGINGHVAAEHAPLGTEHLHQRHYPRLQLLLVPIHAEDAFHGRDADTGVTVSADGVQIGLPSPIAIDAKINRPAHYCDRENQFLSGSRKSTWPTSAIGTSEAAASCCAHVTSLMGSSEMNSCQMRPSTFRELVARR